MRVSQLCLAQAPCPSRTPSHSSCPLPLRSHSPSGQDRRHDPDKWWVKGKVVLRERQRQRSGREVGVLQGLAGGGGLGRGGRDGARLTLKEKLRRMKSAPSFSLRVWRSLCKALSWSTLGSESGLRPLVPAREPRLAPGPQQRDKPLPTPAPRSWTALDVPSTLAPPTLHLNFLSDPRVPLT